MKVNEIVDILRFGFALIKGAVLSLKDGQITIEDGQNFFPAIVVLPAAITGADKVIEQFKNLDEEGKKELFAVVEAEFPDLEDDVKEALIIETIKEVIGDITLGLKWGRYLKKAA